MPNNQGQGCQLGSVCMWIQYLKVKLHQSRPRDSKPGQYTTQNI